MEAYLEAASAAQNVAEARTADVVYPQDHDVDRQLNRQIAVFSQP